MRWVAIRIATGSDLYRLDESARQFAKRHTCIFQPVRNLGDLEQELQRLSRSDAPNRGWDGRYLTRVSALRAP
jgi:hypothetical protein